MYLFCVENILIKENEIEEDERVYNAKDELSEVEIMKQKYSKMEKKMLNIEMLLKEKGKGIVKLTVRLNKSKGA